MAAIMFNTPYDYKKYKTATGDDSKLPVMDTQLEPSTNATRINVSPDVASKFSIGESVIVEVTPTSTIIGKIVNIVDWSADGSYRVILLDKDYTNGIFHSGGTISKNEVATPPKKTKTLLIGAALALVVGVVLYFKLKKGKKG